MTLEIILCLVILVAAVVFFSLEWIPADVVALGILLTLVITRLLPADKAFAGFGSDAVMMILGLLIMTAGLMRTGVVDMAGRWIIRQSGDSPDRLLVVIMLGVAVLSAFISNTAATALFLPVVFGVASRAKQKVSQFLMPLAFASILTSSCTLVSTSTNIVVSDIMQRFSHGGTRLQPMGMFELAPVGIPIAIVGLLYMWFLGRRLIPDRSASSNSHLAIGLKPYLTEVMILPGSPLVGKTLAESGIGRDMELTVVKIVRDKHNYLPPQGDTRLEAGDVLLVEGLMDQILKIKDEAGIDIKADVKLADPQLESQDVALAEAILLASSPLLGHTLKGIGFRERYGLQVLAIRRAGETRVRKISQMRLRMGDLLLIQGDPVRIKALEDGDDLQVLGAISHTRPNVRLAPVAIAIFALVLGAATFKVLSLPVACLLGAFLMFVSRCITPQEAYRDLEWKALIVIGSMLALGSAMEHTGTEKFLAAGIVNLAGAADPFWLLSAFFVLAVLLTQPMSNQAAAAVLVPVAMRTGVELGLNPRTFAMMIAVAASCSYLTPLEPSCLMVYGPGQYRFRDFFKVGGLLTVLIYIVAILLVPLVWPLRS